MKKIILLIIFANIIVHLVYSQKIIVNKSQLLESLEHVDSIENFFYLKINYLSYGKSNAYEILNTLGKNKFIRKKCYTSSIAFSMIGDTTIFYLPIRNVDNKVSDQLFQLQNKSTTAIIKIRAFKNYLYDRGKPFFVIDSIQFTTLE